MTRIKFCGLSRPEDIRAANALGADYVGFVFAPRSRRCVTPAQAAALKALLAPGIQAVGVFADEDPDVVADLLARGIIDLAQLHGGEDAAYVRRLKARTGKCLLQAVSISVPADVRRAASSPADLVLLDAGAGGTGRAFDWSLVRHFPRPYLLAGGLEAGNVGRAVRQLRPYGVDVSSGIETAGRKDPEKMAAFAAAVRKEDTP